MSQDDPDGAIDDLELARIDTALHSYEWNKLAWSRPRHGGGYSHCAVGMLLRDAGVDPEALTRVGTDVWERFGPLLRREYGLPGPEAVDQLVAVNSHYDSREEMAIAALKALMGDESVLPDPDRDFSGVWAEWMEEMSNPEAQDRESGSSGVRAGHDPDSMPSETESTQTGHRRSGQEARPPQD